MPEKIAFALRLIVRLDPHDSEQQWLEMTRATNLLLKRVEEELRWNSLCTGQFHVQQRLLEIAAIAGWHEQAKQEFPQRLADERESLQLQKNVLDPAVKAEFERRQAAGLYVAGEAIDQVTQRIRRQVDRVRSESSNDKP